jgi:hypothetical protein
MRPAAAAWSTNFPEARGRFHVGAYAAGINLRCRLTYQVNMPTLKERFERFMSVLEGVENIDTLMKQCDLPGRKRANYLAFNRHVIIEQKFLRG